VISLASIGWAKILKDFFFGSLKKLLKRKIKEKWQKNRCEYIWFAAAAVAQLRSDERKLLFRALIELFPLLRPAIPDYWVVGRKKSPSSWINFVLAKISFSSSEKKAKTALD
jgi:hypothetical protein